MFSTLPPVSQGSDVGLGAVLPGPHCYSHVIGSPCPSSHSTDFHTLMYLKYLINSVSADYI